uniref:Uncharacterized protein n=1 Tax=Timema poppense TaxID=170557 RepID=A0A7R9CY59_TIMPO|nr:unnamed protein product [Timema poppensis]
MSTARILTSHRGSLTTTAKCMSCYKTPFTVSDGGRTTATWLLLSEIPSNPKNMAKINIQIFSSKHTPIC